MVSENIGTRLFAALATASLVLLSGFIMPSVVEHSSGTGPSQKTSSINTSIASVPVVVFNKQPVSTSNPFDLKVIVNSSQYKQYESQNLQNVYWKTKSNVLIPSWIQNGNSRNSTNTSYWLKLPFSVGPRSNVTIYLAFDNLNAKLFSPTGIEGEFASATQIYGQYGNGANVFEFYDNFAGNALNTEKWNVVYNDTGASYSVSNVLTVTGVYNNGYVSVVTKQKYSGIYEAYLEYTGTNSWGGSGIFLGVKSPVTSGGYYGFHAGYSFFVTDNRPGTGYGSYIVVVDNGSAHNLIQTGNQYTSN